ncbi:hypothetical protein MTO96_011641 [Rhipicephalus appendiculatus]
MVQYCDRSLHDNTPVSSAAHKDGGLRHAGPHSADRDRQRRYQEAFLLVRLPKADSDRRKDRGRPMILSPTCARRRPAPAGTLLPRSLLWHRGTSVPQVPVSPNACTRYSIPLRLSMLLTNR